MSETAAIKLPQGGGAVQGIGETFQPNPFTGTGNFSIPIYTSPGRNGFGPKLTLQYSTGNGNGLFGIGWQLSIPQITCKTEKGLPRYNESDVFVLSGAEDLVPIESTTSENGALTVTLYQPRTEGLFARIEHHVHKTTSANYWKVITKENITNIYGKTANARIENDATESGKEQVHSWLLQETHDAKGNHIYYEYAQESPQLTINTLREENRSYQSQRYIRRIYYGNTPTNLPLAKRVGPQRHDQHFLFELLFDYGDLPDAMQEAYQASPDTLPEYLPVNQAFRPDPFSSYRSGFEIRTLRRCKRVLMIHHFAETDLGSGTIVKSTDFTYTEDNSTNVSFMKAVTIYGHQRHQNGYNSAAMPAVNFTYSNFRPHEQRYQPVTARNNELPPVSLSDPNLTLIDLNGNGLSDILYTTPHGFRFWENLGNGRFDLPRMMSEAPAGLTLAQSGVSFVDMAGDGRPDLLVLNSTLTGFFETQGTTDPGKTWHRFKRINAPPSISPADPNVRLLDLTGDGLSDLLMTGKSGLYWAQCIGEEGYAALQVVQRNPDMPTLFFNDPGQRVRLADMSGDGLNDIVLINNGRIEYWPNLGYGRFGHRVIMENAPRLPNRYDPARLFLADIDGSGCTDMVYVDTNKVYFWFNQSGNGWSDEQHIAGTPLTTNTGNVQFADLFGRGTACLLWSYDLGMVAGSHYKVLDFCGGQKPYLLTAMDNNMGATTRVEYASSTDYYLKDRAANQRWVTSLPFPVHVLAKSEVIDHVSSLLAGSDKMAKTKFTTTYIYHHGYFDGREREFRGFGRVDQFDTETFTDFTGKNLHDLEGTLINGRFRHFHVPPVETTAIKLGHVSIL